MRGWYRNSANRPPPPTCISLETLTADHAELYAHVPPLGQPIPIEVSPFPVDDNIPGEEGISKALLQLQLHRSGGLSGMRSEHLRTCLCTSMWEEDPDTGNW